MTTSPDSSEFPSASELQIAAGVCLRVAFLLSRHIPWWKRWMYSLSALQEVGEKLSAMAAITTQNIPAETRPDSGRSLQPMVGNSGGDA